MARRRLWYPRVELVLQRLPHAGIPGLPQDRTLRIAFAPTPAAHVSTVGTHQVGLKAAPLLQRAWCDAMAATPGGDLNGFQIATTAQGRQSFRFAGAAREETRLSPFSCAPHLRCVMAAACPRLPCSDVELGRSSLWSTCRSYASWTGVLLATSQMQRPSRRGQGNPNLPRPSSSAASATFQQGRKRHRVRGRVSRAGGDHHQRHRHQQVDGGKALELERSYRGTEGYGSQRFRSAAAASATPTDGETGMDMSASDDGIAPAATTTEPPAAHGRVDWELERVDPISGRTPLEDLYERNLDRIRAILERPLPPIPQDGSVDPDFFVGFISYSYQLRDQYRAILADALQVPVKAVHLSVAWSGRFDVKRFARVQKVCGVCLDRQILAADAGTTAAASSDPKDGASATTAASMSMPPPPPSSPPPLSPALQNRIAALVTAINTRKREHLLQAQLFQASLPIPEVEFALTRREHSLIYHLHDWIRRHVLQSTVVVLVYGVPPAPFPGGPSVAAASCSPRSPENPPDDAMHGGVNASQQQMFEQWLRNVRTQVPAQRRQIRDQWMRLFHSRHVIPAVLSLTELATQVAVAVVRGDVQPLWSTAQQGGAAQEMESRSAVPGTDGSAMLKDPTASSYLDEVLREVLLGIAEVVAASVSPPSSTPSSSSNAPIRDVLVPSSQGNSDIAPTSAYQPRTASQQEALMRWVRLIFQALLFREAHGKVVAGGGGDRQMTGMHLTTTLPAFFAQGAYAGGADEVAYLQRNRAAMDALLLHPHEITFKRTFVSRMRNGHRRLAMEEESAALHSSSG